MNKEFLSTMVQKLNDEKKELLSKQARVVDIDHHGDEVDEIQAKILANVEKELSNREFVRVRGIDAALLRIKEGTFGECEECGDFISEKRLNFNPLFTKCISCAEMIELNSKKFIKQ